MFPNFVFLENELISDSKVNPGKEGLLVLLVIKVRRLFAIVSNFHNIQAMYSYIQGDILHIDGITLSVLAEGTGIGFDILVSPTVLS